MRNRKLLYVLIPLIIVVLVLIAGVIYLKLNSSPEKIFANSINKVFGIFKTSEEQYSTVKGSMNLTASMDSDSEEMQAINTALDGTSINLDMQADTANMIINENLNVTVNNESLLNAAILLQDQKGYIYLKDYLDKYLELPEEYMEYSDLTEYYDKLETLDQNKLMEAIKEELIAAISAQELVQENKTLNLDGKETKVVASTLRLKDEQITTFYNQLFGNLNKNEKFSTALGAFREEVQEVINEMLDNMVDAEDIGLEITIYTKGLLNEFVGVSGKVIDDSYYQGYTELEFLKHNESKYELISYEDEREEARLTIEDNKETKNKGTATITIIVDGEQFVVTYNYEKQGKQTSFVASTEIEGVVLSFSGNATEVGKNVKGNFMISVQEETFGKVNLNCTYDFTYGVQIQKVDTRNAVLIDELSEEDQTTLITNLQNSPLYQLIEQSGLLDSGLGTLNDEPEVSYDGFTVKYNVPENFEISEYSSEDFKMYTDEDYNSINITIDYDSVDTYMKDLEDEYVLTSSLYENQEISDTKSMNINGKEYKLRTITYSDEYGKYVNLYFAYELDDEYCYVVEVESEGGNISMDTIKNFLDVTIE